MAVRIAHAVANEFGGTKGGQIGDQKEEVRFGKWSAQNSKGAVWKYYIEFKIAALAERAAQMAEAIVLNQGIGYSQDSNERNTWYQKVKAGGDINTILASCDCSSMIQGIIALLIPGEPYQGSTSSMLQYFPRNSNFNVYRDEAHTRSDNLATRGGIYLRQGHVAIVLSNGPGVQPRTSDVIEVEEDEPPQVSGAPICQIIVDGIKQWCNVRSTPGKELDPIGKAKVNEVFDVYAVEEEWYLIDFHGQPGYIYYDLVSEVREGNV